jgi:hypothetical protein
MSSRINSASKQVAQTSEEYVVRSVKFFIEGVADELNIFEASAALSDETPRENPMAGVTALITQAVEQGVRIELGEGHWYMSARHTSPVAHRAITTQVECYKAMWSMALNGNAALAINTAIMHAYLDNMSREAASVAS